MEKTERVLIYDTTMRDGAQAEGISFSGHGKLRLAQKLDEFGVDYIEGGYAGSNEKDMEFFHGVRNLELRHAKIAAFGSTRRAGVRIQDDPLTRNLLAARTPVTTIFGKSWILHVTDVLRTTREENLAMISDTVAYLKDQRREVIFDAEHFFDGFKDNPEYALRCLEAARSSGADSVVLCDTNGGCLPNEIYEITRQVVGSVKLPVGIHVHNDGGMAVANSLEAVRAGAVQVQGTINGYGERTGNANLCTILPGLLLKMNRSCLKKGSLAKLRELSLFVGDLVNWRHDPKAPYVGESSFAHKGGAHINGVQKNPRTFEHIAPEQVGNERRILVSEQSGGSTVLMKAVEMGSAKTMDKEEARRILAELKKLEAKGYSFESADASFKILVQKILKEHKPFFELEGFRVIVEKRGKDEACLSEATVKVRVKDEIEQTVAEGDGPVNALDTALRKALIRFYPEIAKVVLTDFKVRILDPEEATAAKTRVLIESSDGKDSWGTVGVSENIIEASWEALVDSVEYKLFTAEARRKQHGKRPAKNS
jgi:2-isopropylmalate synthase